MSIKLHSKKRLIPIDDIVVPLHFGTPKLDKILNHHQDYINNRSLEPVIVDSDLRLLDGYISYLIHKHYGHRHVRAYQITEVDHPRNVGFWMRRGNGEVYCSVCRDIVAVCSKNDYKEVMHGVNYCSCCGSENRLEKEA